MTLDTFFKLNEDQLKLVSGILMMFPWVVDMAFKSCHAGMIYYEGESMGSDHKNYHLMFVNLDTLSIKAINI